MRSRDAFLLLVIIITDDPALLLFDSRTVMRNGATPSSSRSFKPEIKARVRRVLFRARVGAAARSSAIVSSLEENNAR